MIHGALDIKDVKRLEINGKDITLKFDNIEQSLKLYETLLIVFENEGIVGVEKDEN